MIDKKILIVTGASSEVGRKLIRSVSDNYAYIWAHFNSNNMVVDELKKELGDKILPIQSDFDDYQSLINMVDTIMQSGKVPDHVVHLSAPQISYEKFQKRSWEEFQQGLDTSVRSIMELLKALISVMSKKKYGKIVFILTSYLVGVAPKYQAPYITTKYALYGLMRCLASELAEKGITVNAISPGMMETQFLNSIPNVVLRVHADTNPLKRNIVIEDVVPSIKYLLSEGADTITGQNIGITGGTELV